MSPDFNKWHVAYVGLGGNVGDVLDTLRLALTELDGHGSIEVFALSDLYKTPPWGNEEQDWFLNACAGLRTCLDPKALLDTCLNIEKKLNRVRAVRWGPRTIDLDILAFDDETVDLDGLQIPHPRMTERAFVLMPLADIAPDLEINGKSIVEWLMQADKTGIERLPNGNNWWGRGGS